MIHASVNDLSLFEVTDGTSRCLGCDQEWYRSWWKRTSGCGPSTFSNILYYISRRSGVIAEPYGREAFLLLMEDVWKSVTPSANGLSSTEAFKSGALGFISRHGLPLAVSELSVPKIPARKPTLNDALNFIAGALNHDAPVAFLALDNGDEKLLDSWHWVTLIALDQEDGGPAIARVLDNCRLVTVDLDRWLATTRRGGGFASVY